MALALVLTIRTIHCWIEDLRHQELDLLGALSYFEADHDVVGWWQVHEHHLDGYQKEIWTIAEILTLIRSRVIIECVINMSIIHIVRIGIYDVSAT